MPEQAPAERAELPKGYWVKVGVLGGLQMALFWGLTMWVMAAVDGDVDYTQLFILAPCSGLLFGITFPLVMRWFIARGDRRASAERKR